MENWTWVGYRGVNAQSGFKKTCTNLVCRTTEIDEVGCAGFDECALLAADVRIVGRVVQNAVDAPDGELSEGLNICVPISLVSF